MDIPYYDKARAAYGTCVQQSLYIYAEPEITSHVPQASSSFPSFAVRAASDRKLGGGISTQCEPESFLPMAMITAMKRSPSTFFAAGACLPYVPTKCTKLRAVCDHYLTEEYV